MRQVEVTINNFPEWYDEDLHRASFEEYVTQAWNVDEKTEVSFFYGAGGANTYAINGGDPKSCGLDMAWETARGENGD